MNRTPSPRIAILDYGMGNLRSVEKALEHVGASASIGADPDTVRGADGIVLPGVGAFPRAMERIRAAGIDALIEERRAAGVPILGICLGLQLALEESEEDGGVAGLGILPGRARRLRDGRVPRIGWATIEPGGETFYFAHSYAAETSAVTARSEGVVAVAEAGSFLGVQFHPEKSGAAGGRYLAGVLEGCLSRA
jgi:glutamine amidotransferase